MKKMFTLIALAILSFGANAQNDFSISWNQYAAGSTVTDDPFLGGFTIENVGTSTISTGDTIFYAYSIGTTFYSIDLQPGFVSLRVLTADFMPGDTIKIDNPIAFNPIDTTIEMCAVVFGQGFASVPTFTGDDDPTNNITCLDVVIPADPTSVESIEESLSRIYVAENQLVIESNITTNQEQADYSIINMSGQVVQSSNFTLQQGTSRIQLSNVAKGIYIVRITANGTIATRKISIQ